MAVVFLKKGAIREVQIELDEPKQKEGESEQDFADRMARFNALMSLKVKAKMLGRSKTIELQNEMAEGGPKGFANAAKSIIVAACAGVVGLAIEEDGKVKAFDAVEGEELFEALDAANLIEEVAVALIKAQAPKPEVRDFLGQ